jgi:hypothetical protein
MTPPTRPVLNETALSWCGRGLWALCIAVYLTVFVGGILAHGDELFVMARAIGLTLLTGLLGKFAIALLARASLPEEEGPSADATGPNGSLVEPMPSTNVAEQEDRADAA